jgi:hypothetical protein
MLVRLAERRFSIPDRSGHLGRAGQRPSWREPRSPTAPRGSGPGPRRTTAPAPPWRWWPRSWAKPAVGDCDQDDEEPEPVARPPAETGPQADVGRFGVLRVQPGQPLHRRGGRQVPAAQQLRLQGGATQRRPGEQLAPWCVAVAAVQRSAAVALAAPGLYPLRHARTAAWSCWDENPTSSRNVPSRRRIGAPARRPPTSCSSPTRTSAYGSGSAGRGPGRLTGRPRPGPGQRARLSGAGAETPARPAPPVRHGQLPGPMRS